MMFDPAALQQHIARWHNEGGVLYHESAPAPGRWTEMLDAFLVPCLQTGDRALVTIPLTPVWRLDIHNDLPSLTPVESLPPDVHTVLVSCPGEYLTTLALLQLRRQNVNQCWLREANTWRVDSVDHLLAHHLYHRKVKRVLRLISPGLCVDEQRLVRGMGEHLQANHTDENNRRDSTPASSTPQTIPAAPTGPGLWHREIRADNQALCTATDRPNGRPLRIMHYIGSLSAGGAERQLCNLAIGQKKAGHDVRVRTTYETTDHLAHYSPLLTDANIDVHRAGDVEPDFGPQSESFRWDLLSAVPADLNPFIASLARELIADPPDILHCWLDHPSIMGGLAGIIAGVPHILLSTRNSNPTNFPRLYAPYLDTWYHILAESRRVHWLANSHSGAGSYASWLNMPVDRVHVVLNGLFSDHFDRPGWDERHRARRHFNLSPDVPVVAVINRLSEEKQPELMLKVISLVRPDVPNLQVLVAGVGPLENRMKEIIARRGLQDCVHLIGRVTEVDRFFCASDVLLLTSTLEGCPNVALEAQHVGVPVVATAGGGTTDAVMHGQTGFLCGVQDAVGLATALRRLLTDAPLRNQFGRTAQTFVDRCFSIPQLVELTNRVYDHMLNGDPSAKRIITPKPDLETTGEVDEVESKSDSDRATPFIETRPIGSYQSSSDPATRRS